jgi:hypothetical protein
MDRDGLIELMDMFLPGDSEIEQTVPSCDTCLHEEKCGIKPEELECGGPECCVRFIPKSWREHIMIAGNWWS